MKIELTEENSAALTKYAALAGHTPGEFLNGYLQDNMLPLFENPRSSELESHLGNLEYHTRADAERVVAWMEKRGTGRPQGAATLETGIEQTDEDRANRRRAFWIEATTIRNGQANPIQVPQGLPSFCEKTPQ
jgi:hypothetical protein